MRMMHKISIKLFLITTVVFASAVASFAQSSAFTYQGRLVMDGSPADGLFEFEFKLFDALTDGNQIGQATVPQTIQVTNGVFVAQLDFGPGAFNGPNRFLEISVGPTGGQRTLLAPRQPIASTPYALKSMSATTADALSGACVGCVTNSQIQSISVSQITTGILPIARGGTGLSSTGAVGNFLRSNGNSWNSSPLTPGDLPSGSSRYIQNSLGQQQSSNFNISGNGMMAGFLAVGSSSGSAGYKLYVVDDSNKGLRVTNLMPGGTVASFGEFGDFQIDTSISPGGRFTVKENGMAGVGISNPGFKLHVIDEANTGLRVQTNTSGGTVASFGGYGAFLIDADGVVGGRLTVKENGQVGIGTDSPEEKLSVAGTIQSTAGGFKFPDGTVQTTSALASALGETYTAFRPLNTIVEIPPRNSQPAPVIGLNIPAGNYMISATIDFDNRADIFAQDNRRSIQCTLVDEIWRFTLGAALDDVDRRQILNLHSVKIFNQPTTLQINCVALTGGTDESFVRAIQRRLTATRIGNISVQ